MVAYRLQCKTYDRHDRSHGGKHLMLCYFGNGENAEGNRAISRSRPPT